MGAKLTFAKPNTAATWLTLGGPSLGVAPQQQPSTPPIRKNRILF